MNKNQKITDLEAKLAVADNCADRYWKQLGVVEDENKKLKQQLAEMNKALELACERIKYFEEMQDKELGHFELFGYENEYDLKSIIKYYIKKAKEIEND